MTNTISSPQLYRLGGLALMASVPFWFLGELLHPRGEGLADVLNSNNSLAHGLLFVGWFLILLGLPALHAGQAERAGVFGIVAFVPLMLLAVFHLYLLAYEAGPMAILSADPAAPSLFPADGPVQRGTLRGVLGPTIFAAPLYAVAALRARVFPASFAWLLISWLPLFFGLRVAYQVTGSDLQHAIGSLLSPVGVSYGFLNVGFAIAGYQLWTGRAWAFGRRAVAEPAAYS